MEITVTTERTVVEEKTYPIRPGQLWHRRDGGMALIVTVEDDVPGNTAPIEGVVHLNGGMGRAGVVWYMRDGRLNLRDGGSDPWDLIAPVTEDNPGFWVSFDKPES